MAKTANIETVDNAAANDTEHHDHVHVAEAGAQPKPKKPQPGDADYDWSQHYDTDDLYTHTFPNGKTVALKAFGTIYSKTWLYKLRNAKSDSEIEFAAIARGGCAEAEQVLESLDDSGADDPIADLFKAWVKAGTSRGDGDEGLTPGN